MPDERNMEKESQWFASRIAERCLAALEQNNIKGHYVQDRIEARSKLLEMIPKDSTIGAGSSTTLVEIEIIPELEKRGHQIYDPFWKDGQPYEAPMMEVLQHIDSVGRKAIAADVFLTGINAITLDGKLVNTDACGNRAAALLFGPERVIAICGINKIVGNLDEALKRVKQVAAPMNSKRLTAWGYPPAPCGATGLCNDCKSPSRQCAKTVIVEYQGMPRIEVLLVGEPLGF